MSAINWMELVKAWRGRLDKAGLVEQFRAYAAMVLDAPYVWGSENPQGTDCSGTVCFPLWMMGFNIRVTADVLFKQLFTIVPVDEADLSHLMAVFYVAKGPQDHHGNSVPTGTAVHVTPVLGRNVVLNAGDRVTLSTALTIRQWFESRNCSAVWREIDWKKVQEMSASLKFAWDIDPVLSLIRAA